jgi:hypothetical protein
MSRVRRNPESPDSVRARLAIIATERRVMGTTPSAATAAGATVARQTIPESVRGQGTTLGRVESKRRQRKLLLDARMYGRILTQSTPLRVPWTMH